MFKSRQSSDFVDIVAFWNGKAEVMQHPLVKNVMDELITTDEVYIDFHSKGQGNTALSETNPELHKFDSSTLKPSKEEPEQREPNYQSAAQDKQKTASTK